jgi:hypothetical protein
LKPPQPAVSPTFDKFGLPSLEEGYTYGVTFFLPDMRLYLTPLVAVLLMPFLSSGQVPPTQNECPELRQVSTEITHTTGSVNNGEVLLKLPEGLDSRNYQIFWLCTGCSDSRRASEPTKVAEPRLQQLSAGFYDIYIVGKDGCYKQLNVQVK